MNASSWKILSQALQGEKYKLVLLKVNWNESQRGAVAGTGKGEAALPGQGMLPSLRPEALSPWTALGLELWTLEGSPEEASFV